MQHLNGKIHGPKYISIIIGVSALIVGIIAGKLIFAKNTRKKIEEAELTSPKHS